MGHARMASPRLGHAPDALAPRPPELCRRRRKMRSNVVATLISLDHLQISMQQGASADGLINIISMRSTST
eukprot:4529089-Pyramimonas_sp.AAC.1